MQNIHSNPFFRFILPFCNHSGRSSPHRVFPTMPYPSHFTNLLFIDLDSQSGTIENLNVSVFKRKNIRILYIVEQIAPYIIMNTGACFLNNRIDRIKIQLQARGKAIGPSGQCGATVIS